MTELSSDTLTGLYRFACMLRGQAAAAGADLLAVLAADSAQIAQLRNEKRATVLVLARLLQRVGAAPAGGDAEPGQGETAKFLWRFSRLPEPQRSALALFYLNLLSIEEIARFLNVELEELAERIGKGRSLLRALGEEPG